MTGARPKLPRRSRPPTRRRIPARAGLPRWLFEHHPLSLAVAVFSVLLATVLLLDGPLHGLGDTLDPSVHRFFAMLTRLGKSDWSIVLAAALCLGFTQFARRALRHRTAVLWRHAAGQAGFVLAAILTSGIAANILKWGLGRGRPGVMTGDATVTFAPIATSADWASFPSGHATTIVALGLALGFLIPRWRVALLSVALWVAASRVIVGAHWASDVVAGIALGTACVFALRLWYARRGRVFVLRNGGLQPRTACLVPFLRNRIADAARRAISASIAGARHGVAVLNGTAAPKRD